MATVPNTFTNADNLGVKLNQNFKALREAASSAENQFLAYQIWQNCMFVGSTSSYSLPTSTTTNVPINSEAYDPYGWHTGTSHLVTPNVAGYYTATLLVEYANAVPAVTRIIGHIMVGSSHVGRFDMDGISGHPRFTVTAPDFYLDGTQSVHCQLWQNGGSNKTVDYKFSLRLVNPT